MALSPNSLEENNLILSVYNLSSEKEILQYKYFLQLFPKHPMYNRELMLFGKGDHEELMYFILMADNCPMVLMPFLIRKVFFKDKETGYYDVSSPYGYSGPIFSKNTDGQIASIFWDRVDEWYRKNKVVSEFIRFNMLENWKGYNGKIMPTLSNVCGKILPEEVQWERFKPKVRNNYRKSVTYGLRSAIYHGNITEEVIVQFHDIYTGTMERNNANSQYFYELEYFVDLINNNPSTCAIVIIYKDDVAISAELLLLSDTTINSFLGGTVSEYFYMRPNDFLKIEVLKWAREKKYIYYLLGGGRENNDSLYHYKKNFFPSDEDLVFYTGRKIIDESIYTDLVNNSPYCADCINTNYFPLYRCRQY